MKISKSEIQNCIANGNLEAAIKMILVLSDKYDKNLHTQSILLSGRFNSLMKDQRMGVLTAERITIRNNQISHALSQMLKDVMDDWVITDTSLKMDFDYRVDTGKNEDEKKSVRTILFLAANPNDTKPLKLDKEVRQIEDRLKQSKQRDSFKLVQKWAVDITSLQSALLEESPNIVHFSGHGSHVGRIILEDVTGNGKEIPSKALGNFFRLFKDHINCVILNACYSRDQAMEISKHIPFVIGMKTAVLDKAAIVFSSAFYNALGNGRDVEFAFELAKNSIEMFDIKGEDIPVLIKKE